MTKTAGRTEFPTHVVTAGPGLTSDGAYRGPGEMVDLAFCPPDTLRSLEGAGRVRRLNKPDTDSAHDMLKRAAAHRARIKSRAADAEATIAAVEREWEENEVRVAELQAAVDEREHLINRRDALARSLKQARSVVVAAPAELALFDEHERLGRVILETLGETE